MNESITFFAMSSSELILQTTRLCKTSILVYLHLFDSRFTIRISKTDETCILFSTINHTYRKVANDQLDILAITETFLSDDVNDSELADCSKYRVFRRDRNRHGGGVMVIVRGNLPAVRRKDLETECEVIWIELIRRNKPILFGVYYRPPNTAANLSQLRCSLSALPSMHHILLCGGFNAPSINWDTTSVRHWIQQPSI